jgi:hypothetical protein
MRLADRFSNIALAAALLPATIGSAAAQTPQQFEVPLSDPSRPVRLEASLLSGSIHVEAHDGDGVRVEAVPGEERHSGSSGEGRGGMKRIPNTSLGLTITERDNVVEVGGSWNSRVMTLRILVPRRTSLQLSTTNNGDLQVSGVEGELELQNTNGAITAVNVRGSVVAQTTNGDVKVVFSAIDPGKAMSFATFNGDVDVTFPASLAADLRLESGQGDIFTDFDFELQPQQPRVERGESGRGRVIEIEQHVRARVGGGGPEMRFKTFNGDIFVRRSGA